MSDEAKNAANFVKDEAKNVANIAKHFSENVFASAKKIGDLNLKAFELLSTKQAELLKSYIDAGSKHAEAIVNIKDFGELASLQQETSRTLSEQWATSLRETTEILTGIRDEWTVIAEESVKYTQAETEKALEVGKQVATKTIEKTTEAVEKATAEVVELTKNAAAKTVEATKKTAHKVQSA